MKLRKLCSTLAVALVACSSAFAATYTLSIGINDYPDAKDEKGQVVDNDLRGCVNDANALQALFVSDFNVPKANTKVLLDKDASLAGMVDGIKWLISKAKTGDQVVFSYSGHGGQVEDDAEEDGFTEVLVTADEQLIPDDLFNELAKLFTLNGIHSTFIFDSCHSGGMSRSVDGKIKVAQRSLGILKPRSATQIAQARQKFTSVLPRRVMIEGTSAQSLFLFASEEKKTSSDISGLEGIPAHGLFTLLMLEVLREEAQSSVVDLYDTINGVLADINASLKKQGSEQQFDQNPFFETQGGREKQPILLKN